MTAALLLLADSRLPSGAHAHSGGVESAVAAGRIHDFATLAGFLRGRLSTVGLVGAAATAMVAHRISGLGCAPADCVDPVTFLHAVEAAMDARTPSAVLRRVSRSQGRALLRAGRCMWTVPVVHTDQPHQPVALGLVAAAAGVAAREAATAAAYSSVAGPATAAVRLLGLDPYLVHALLAELGPRIDAVAERACSTMEGEVDVLPACGAPLLDITAEKHATWEVRLFAS